MDKLKKIKVTTPVGERTLTFRPSCAPRDRYVCETCPYCKVCEHIPDPRCPDDKTKSFLDFCGDIEHGNIESTESETQQTQIDVTSEMIPVEGTIESNLEDLFDINKELIKRNSLVRLQEVVQSVCAGWCEDYDPSYCNCSANNASCLLCNLFKNHKIEFTPEEYAVEEESGNESQEEKSA